MDINTNLQDFLITTRSSTRHRPMLRITTLRHHCRSSASVSFDHHHGLHFASEYTSSSAPLWPPTAVPPPFARACQTGAPLSPDHVRQAGEVSPEPSAQLGPLDALRATHPRIQSRHGLNQAGTLVSYDAEVSEPRFKSLPGEIQDFMGGRRQKRQTHRGAACTDLKNRNRKASTIRFVAELG